MSAIMYDIIIEHVITCIDEIKYESEIYKDL